MDEGISVESNQDHVIVVLSILKILINVKEIYVISFLEKTACDHPVAETLSNAVIKVLFLVFQLSKTRMTMLC